MRLNQVVTSEHRFEIECKLETELASLETLRETQEQSQKLTSNMVSILSSLEDRLATLRRTIVPVYNETGSLQNQQFSKSSTNNKNEKQNIAKNPKQCFAKIKTVENLSRQFLI